MVTAVRPTPEGAVLFVMEGHPNSFPTIGR
jgi:hypothetical protein